MVMQSTFGNPSPAHLRRLARTLGGLLVASLAVLPAAYAAQGGPEMPAQLQESGKSLQLNGRSTFRKFMFSVYDVGLYLENPTRDPDQIIASEQTKLLRIRLLHDVTGAQVADMLRQRLQQVAPAEKGLWKGLEGTLGQLPDLNAGANLVIAYHPTKGTTELAVGGKRIVLAGKGNADANLKIWLGHDQWAAQMRAELAGG